jgi:pimeloyl-ACP methyl ester carboxylesterase
VDSFVFVGHSTGELVDMHMARALPERVHTLVLEIPMGLEDYRNGLMRQVRHQDRTYVGAKYTPPKDQGAKGNIAEMAKGFAARMPKARFVGVPNTGHVPHLESPAAFSSAVLEFLR